MTARKPTAPPKGSKGAKKAEPKKTRPDWEAIERDYRTGRYSLRELATLHNANHATIGRRVDKEGWTKDLSDAIRQATNAKLIEEATRQSCDDARQSATNTVLVAAEVNKQVILGHRTALREIGERAETMREKLMTIADSVADVREIAVALGALESYARITKTRIEKEREAFGITSGKDDDEGSKKRQTSGKYEYSDDELLAEIAAIKAERERVHA